MWGQAGRQAGEVGGQAAACRQAGMVDGGANRQACEVGGQAGRQAGRHVRWGGRQAGRHVRCEVGRQAFAQQFVQR